MNKWPEKETYVHVHFSLTFVYGGEKNVNVIDQSLSSIFPGPQSPCERTDLRMAIVADHLGLSWTGGKHSALFVFSLLVHVVQTFSLWPHQYEILLFTAIFRLTQQPAIFTML